MTRAVVTDASIVVAWSRPQEHGVEVAAFNFLLSAHGRNEIRLRLPAFALLEIANPLLIKHKRSSDEVSKVLTLLKKLGLVEASIELESIMATPRLAGEHGLTTYDAYYVAVAQQLSAELISIDGDLTGPGLATLPSSLLERL